MIKFLVIIKLALKDFLINGFWRTWYVLAVIGVSILLNGALWYFFTTKIRQNPNPFILVSGLLVLNIILADYLWNRENLASMFLLITTLVIEIFMLIFARYLIVIY